jgi:GNAT superfamily N-acetyltransferase
MLTLNVFKHLFTTSIVDTYAVKGSPWAHYIAERENAEVYETSKGFAVYTITAQTIYIQDIWVHPEHRNKHVATNIADAVVVIAIERGCTQMVGSVCPTAKNAHQSLQILLSYGMRLMSSQNNIIFFSMELT